MGSNDAAFPSLVNTVNGMSMRAYFVGQVVTGLVTTGKPIPPLNEIWDLAEKILVAGEKWNAQQGEKTNG